MRARLRKCEVSWGNIKVYVSKCLRKQRSFLLFGLPGALLMLIYGIYLMVSRPDHLALMDDCVPESIAEAPAELRFDDAWNYFHPFWKRQSAWSLLPTEATHAGQRYPRSHNEVRDIMLDPKGRIDDEFSVPPSMQQRVIFWINVYSRYTSHMRVVHDRHDPAIVYGTIDFRPIYRAYKPSAILEKKLSDIEKKIITELKVRIYEAIHSPRRGVLSSEERMEIRNYLMESVNVDTTDALRLTKGIRTQTGQSDIFLSALYRAREMLPHIENVFRRHELPTALSRIPFVESSFNNAAVSTAGAMGLWQFTPSTARQVIHHQFKSHWKDPLLQTNGAAKLLKLYRKMLPDWGTTVTSYNAGIGRIHSAVKAHKVKNIEQLLQISNVDGFGFASRNFFAEFLAAAVTEAYKDELFSPWLVPSEVLLAFKGMGFPNERTCTPRIQKGSL